MNDLLYECIENDIATMLTTELPIHMLLAFPLSFPNYRLSQQKFLVGLAIFIWNLHHLVLKVLPIGEVKIRSGTAETLPGILIDSELNFENQLFAICNKVSRKSMFLVGLPIICP